MKRKLLTPILILTVLFLFSSSLTAQDCKTITDEAIVSSLLKRVESNSSLSKQLSHINIQSVNRAIKLQGWVDGKKDFSKLQELALETDCATMVNVNGLTDSQPESFQSCSAGTKPCGDICIPDKDTCNIGIGRQARLFDSSPGTDFGIAVVSFYDSLIEPHEPLCSIPMFSHS